jgi:hypothetical protein
VSTLRASAETVPASSGDVRPLLLGGLRELHARVLEHVVDHPRADRSLRRRRDALEEHPVAEEVQEVGAPRPLARPLARHVVEHRAQGGMALEARDRRRTVLALAPRQITERAPRLVLGPSLVRRHVDVRAQPAKERLQEALEPLGRHDDARPDALRSLPPEVRDAMQGDRRLAVARLAENEQRAARRPRHRVALRGGEVDVDEGRRAPAKRLGTRGKDRHGGAT